jgi:hypothetical protein
MSKAYREPAPMPPPPPEPYDESADIVAFIRGAGRRQALVNASMWIGGIVVAGLAVLLALAIVQSMFEQRENCRRKGGTWFESEDKCLDVREIK